MTAPRQLGTFTTMEELQAIMRVRAEELEQSRETTDALAGISPGQASRLLAPNPSKKLGDKTTPRLSRALAMTLIAVDDEEQRKRITADQPKRNSNLAKHGVVVHLVFSRRHMRKIGKKGGAASRSKVSSRRARQIGQRAARARWQKSVIDAAT